MKKIFGFIILLFALANNAFAYQIQSAEKTIPGDFLLGPGKKEFVVQRGQSVIDTIEIINNSGSKVWFEVTVEDIQGTNDPKQAFQMLGPGSGPYSLKDYIFPETPSFYLEDGQKIVLPIEIKIPYDISLGGLYGSVIVQTKESQNQEENSGEIQSGTKIIGRLAHLVFIRIEGNQKEEGILQDFFAQKDKEQRIILSSVFENRGNIHLNPYGKIELLDWKGQKKATMAIDPYFVLPNSKRQRDFNISNQLGFGKYRAYIYLNRGYGDIIDTKYLDFWVVSNRDRAILIVLVTLFLGILIFRKSVNKLIFKKIKKNV